MPTYAGKVSRALKQRIRQLARNMGGSERIFDGDDTLFKRYVSESKIYAEYGCGKSTVWASFNSRAKIISVDTSNDWIRQVQILSSPGNMPDIEWIDCGALGDWGRPVDFSMRHNFKRYIFSPFMRASRSPDFVLVDGRFRVACFLAALVKSEPTTRILFDDYTTRDHYHLVEEYCGSPEIYGRQALFVTPELADTSSIEEEIERFMYVRE